MQLAKDLIRDNYLKTPHIIEAFRAIDRADFMRENTRQYALMDGALPIGHGQTISQPAVVAIMFELLQPAPGHVVLDVGSGSGWTTALLGHIVGQGTTGRVTGVERVPELASFGRENIARYGLIDRGVADIVHADGGRGYYPAGPFDRILCSATTNEIPRSWRRHLRPGGKIVTPVSTSLWLFEKLPGGRFAEKEIPGFAFVPLVTE